MLIDFHMHIGRLYWSDRRGLSPDYVLRFMDRNGIDQACLLPMENPEHTDYYVTTDYVLRVCRRHPDRFIPFCNVDPRRTQVRELLREYRDRGCRGYGETISTLAIDDPLMQTVYEACGELRLPIIFDFMLGDRDRRSCWDEPGLPRFETMVRQYPQTTFVGHGPHFWANIAAHVPPTESYPSGPVAAPGAVVRLLSTYPNAYADLSAGSGRNAIRRDPAFGDRFLEQCCDHLLFGTDLCRHGQVVPHADDLRQARAEGRLSQDAFDKIAWRNARSLLDPA